MEKDFKLLLVLSGPLISHGSTGNIEKNIHRSKRISIEFDVTKNIIEYSRLAKNLNIEIYYIAWEKDFENINRLAKTCAVNLKVLSVKEPVGIKPEFLQFFSLNFFLEKLKEKSELSNFYILKIRSDLLLNLNLLISELSLNNSFINVPHLYSSGKFADFYYASSAEKLLAFCSNILMNKESISPKFHYSAILKQYNFLRELEKHQIVIDDLLASYFCIKYTNENLFPFSISLHQSCLWRGEKYNKYFYTQSHIFRQWGVKPSLKIDLPESVKLEDIHILASFLEGLALYKKGKLALAEKIFKEIIKQNPDHYESLDLINKIKKNKGWYSSFLNYFK